ncbi:MAG: HlyD family secretion protein [Rhodobacteraceae bacterium]|uniref:HlyD family type I secretion periplasmic adaptor subunit n=1 Tax=Cypionkella sp. TaxID=2811411 RepID=UPI001328719F|nr:HlyD family type I secretion periplasmic adaptor subunit [Cypionkella sp.]KAF0176169.1 MAG: HlyD family secretion protein [Paracoccaceae bacterium]MDO8328661.1 HlyD family type I secretion periplasmic adaptor subunit [Cypionkella sp.]
MSQTPATAAQTNPTAVSPTLAAKPVAKGAAWSARRPVIVGLVTVALLVGGFGGWTLFTEIDGAIVSSGQLEVAQNRQIVQHPDGGVVAEIAVKEAQPVKAGDLLIRLDGSLLQSELAIVEGQLFETLSRRARLEAERDDKAEPVFSGELAELAKTRPDVVEQIEGQRKLFFARRESTARQSEQLDKRSAQIASQIDGINAQNTALQSQLVLIQQELTNQQSLLDKGLAQSSRVLALQREEASLQGRSGELTAARAQAEGRATEIELEILRLAAVRREEANAQLRDLGPQALELVERRRALIERISRLEIRAPVSGIVLGMQVTTPRSVLRAAEPVLYIIPQDRPLVITAQVQPIHIDEVHVGQKVRVVFPAFSARTTPELFGHVATVSADALVDQRTQIPFFRAEILLDDGELAKLTDQTLLPGMPVEAFIETGARSPMSYLLKPFTDYFNQAFRES